MPDRSQPRIVPSREGDTPPGPLPVIGNASVVRVKLGLLISAATGMIGLVVWLTIMYANQQWIIESLKQLQADVRSIKDHTP